MSAFDDCGYESFDYDGIDNFYGSDADASAAADAAESFGKNHGSHYGGGKLFTAGRSGFVWRFI